MQRQGNNTKAFKHIGDDDDDEEDDDEDDDDEKEDLKMMMTLFKDAFLD